METNSEDISWLWQKRFVGRAAFGSVFCAILVLAVTSSWVFKPLYESEVVVCVPLTILSQQLNQQGIGFASDREIDWYIQILKSNQLADSLIARYDLFDYFKVNPSELDAKNQVYQKMESRIFIGKTQYGSVTIRVRDSDEKRAADMANDMVALGEVIKRNLLFPNRLESIRYVSSLYNQKTSDVARLESSIDSLLNTSGGMKKDYLLKKMETFYQLELQELIARKGAYEREQKNFDTPLPSVYIISSAVPTSKSIWPKRYLLMGVAAGIYLLIIVSLEIIRRDNRKTT